MKSKLAIIGLVLFLIIGCCIHEIYIKNSNLVIQGISYILSYVIAFWLIHTSNKYDNSGTGSK